MKTLIIFLLLISAVCVTHAETYQYIVVGYGNGKKVTGFVTELSNGTIQGSVDGKFVSGEWDGLGMMELSDGESFYEMDVTD